MPEWCVALQSHKYVYLLKLPEWCVALQSWQYFKLKRITNTAHSTFAYVNETGVQLHKSYKSFETSSGHVEDRGLADKLNWIGLGCLPEKWDNLESARSAIDSW